ncbi:polysaccharide biosynthesis tyrosine autokinase [Sphaerospermopsis aphanizomenoides BCCUSP55]|uniref:GumC family protein n=1 Tax=Sphaerospermopsis aphanizomenoides TaxID=459663 RepID=UPI000A6393C9|nr:polysaccharide biosynthesis tyrosine autokinase [Sphaerospermopsis aphanizomenoides]MBK1987121.1 polysaccharide biosynthesis tyrosine autokinase [Sphaerospermopsis aphanizomenoides BCCUSP55]
MNNQNSTRISTPNENGRVIIAPELLPPQNFSSFETEDDDGNLKDFLGVLQRRALVIIGVVSVVMSTVIYSTLKEKTIYQGHFQLLVEPVNSDSDLGQIPLPNSNFSKSNLDYESQIQVLRSQELMKDILPKLKYSDPDITYNSLIGNLTIRRVGMTKVIEISYRNQDRQKIKSVLETLSKFYLEYSLEKRKTKLNQGVQFVDKQLPTIKNRVAQLQQQLQIFRQRYNFVDPENQSNTVATQLQQLEQEQLEIEQQLAIARATYISLSTPEGQQATLNAAPIYSQLISQLRQLEAQLSGELVRFQPDSRPIETLEEKRQNLLPLIEDEQKRYIGLKLAEATTMIQRLEVQSQELSRIEQQTKLKFQQLPVLTKQYTELLRNLQLANDSLNRFLATRENLVIQVAQTELPWELIQPPTQGELPILPNIPRNLLMGFLSSIAVGVAIGFLLEKLDNTYHDVASLKEKMKLPFLGTLPIDKSVAGYQSSYPSFTGSESESRQRSSIESNGWLSNLLRRQNKSYNYYGQGLFWESLQVLYANIQLLNSDQPIRSLTVSSTMPGDGKTTVSFHLAQIAAALGKRVLLVDGDLRRAQVHKLSNLRNFSGLSNVLTSNMPVEQVIQQLPEMSSLSVITAGPVPPDPARLLASDKMKQLMEYFNENYDLVIYDAPPMLGLVDARLLAPQTDGMVLVVRIDKTDKSALMQLQDSLRNSPINVLGVVANGDKQKLTSYNYYYSAGREARQA